MDAPCARCGSTKIIPEVPLLDHFGDVGAFTRKATVEVVGEPQAWIFKDRLASAVYARICGECGHLEFYIKGHRQLYEKFLKSQGPTG